MAAKKKAAKKRAFATSLSRTAERQAAKLGAPAAAQRSAPKKVKIVVTGAFKAVSYSRLRDYETCPYYAALKHIQKMKEPEGPAIVRGNAVHKAAEDFIQGKARKIAPELQAVEGELRRFKKEGAAVEAMWGFTRKWEPCGWFDWDHCFNRVKADVWHAGKKLAELVDWKTGRYNEEKVEFYRDQLNYYAPAGLIMAPKVEGVKTRIEFVDHAKTVEDYYKRSALPALIKDWERRFKPMLADTAFKPRPCANCRFCAFSAAKGGPCIF